MFATLNQGYDEHAKADNIAQPVDDTSTRRQNMSDMGIASDRNPATQEIGIPVAQSGNGLSDGTSLVDQQLYDGMSNLSLAELGDVKWHEKYNRIVRKMRQMKTIINNSQFSGHPRDMMGFATLQTLKNLKGSIAYLDFF